MISIRSKLFFLCFLFLFSLPAWADKTDVVFLKNGDRVTGEIKGLDKGILELSTDHMGTVFIEWRDIEEVVSTTGQSIELTNGQRFYGELSKPEITDMVNVETGGGTVGLSIDDIIAMYPVGAGFWDRLDISASLGFSWDKGSSVGRYTVGMDTEYRDPAFITRANFIMEITTQEGRDNSKRATLDAHHLRFKMNKQYLGYFGSLERNDELGLDLRTLLGAGYGWVPVRSNNNWFSLAAGLDVNREIPTDGESSTNLEAVGMVRYEYYRYSQPKRKFSANLAVFPGLTDWGRWRANFTTDFRWELISDLFWNLNFYASFDSSPISENASKSDYGITSSLGYNF
jgi:hypothetical protein